VQEDVLRIAELSASDCKRLCAIQELALCLDLIRGRRIWRGVHRSPVLCGVALWLCAQEQRNVRKIEDQ
jgi:hypothetical protein